MRHRLLAIAVTLAAVPYLLLSSSRQAGVITHLAPDGSGERLVYARAATDRAPEALKYVRRVIPGEAREGRASETESLLLWRDMQGANLQRIADVEIVTRGIIQAPLSIFTYHTWKETLSFDRGDATEVELQGKSLAELKYILRMPGKVTSQSPPAKVENNRIEWDVRPSANAQTFTAESRTVRWAYILLLLYVLVFLGVKTAEYAPRVARQIRRRPRRI